MPTPIHGKGQVFKLSGVDAALADISACLDGAVSFDLKYEHPEDSALSHTALRHRTTGRGDAPIGLSGQVKYTSVTGAPIQGKGTVLFYNQYALASSIMKGSVNRSIELPNSETLGDTFLRRGVIGREKTTGAVDGLFASGAGTIADIFESASAADPAVNVIHTIGYGATGAAVGQLVDLVQIIPLGVKVGADKANIVPIAIAWENDDVLDTGVSLHDNTAETATVNGTTVNEQAATTGGWVAHLHITAIAGGAATIKLQDSADGASWTDLASGSFGSLSAVGGTRLDGGTSATVRQYVRMIISAMTASSVTFVVGFARRTYVNATLAPAGTHRAFAQLLTIATAPTFVYSPAGGAASTKKYSGSCRLMSYGVAFDKASITKFTASLVTDNTVTIGTN